MPYQGSSVMSKFCISISNPQVVEFLAILAFNETKDTMEAACIRAYRDMCRTIRRTDGYKFSALSANTKIAMRIAVSQTIKKRLSRMEITNLDQNYFDNWHKKTCETIKNVFAKKIGNGWKLSYGQAQKWLNMTLKYLYVLSYNFTPNQLACFHAPLDSYIFEVAQNQLSIRKPSKDWSKMDYKEYMDYQRKIREHMTGTTVFYWELCSWNEAAARHGTPST